MKFVLQINSKLLTVAISFLLSVDEHGSFSANKYENANYCWHFHIYKQRKFHAQLSYEKGFIISGSGSVHMRSAKIQISLIGILTSAIWIVMNAKFLHADYEVSD